MKNGDTIKKSILISATILLSLAALGIFINPLYGSDILRDRIARIYFLKQDLPILMISLLSMVTLSYTAPIFKLTIAQNIKTLHLIIFLSILTILLYIIRCDFLFNYDLSRDEKMVTFDSAIYHQGRLFYPLSEFWRRLYPALNPLFILPVGDRDGWVSSYLPVNAALRGLLTWVMPANLVSPLLVLTGGIIIWRISRRLWPDSHQTQTVVLLLYIGSSQVMVAGTTTYAMTAHMTFNLLWLWLFLQHRPAACAGAIIVGFFATGLHQPIFHPLFVAPFFILLRQERRWGELIQYSLGYACIGLFWSIWPTYVSGLGAHPVPIILANQNVGYLGRLLNSIEPLTLNSVWLMCLNILRFFTWQHILMLPLMVIGLLHARNEEIILPLICGIFLLLIVMFGLMAPQAWGWGYRYLQGFIGNGILVAGYGWRYLERKNIAPLQMMGLATAISMALVLPLHFLMARQFLEPFARAESNLSKMDADVVIIDDDILTSPFVFDLIINQPDVTNRPIMLGRTRLRPSDIPILCQTYNIAFVNGSAFKDIYALLYLPPVWKPSEELSAMHRTALAAKCST